MGTDLADEVVEDQIKGFRQPALPEDAGDQHCNGIGRQATDPAHQPGSVDCSDHG